MSFIFLDVERMNIRCVWYYYQSLNIRNAHFNETVFTIESTPFFWDMIKKGKQMKKFLRWFYFYLANVIENCKQMFFEQKNDDKEILRDVATIEKYLKMSPNRQFSTPSIVVAWLICALFCGNQLQAEELYGKSRFWIYKKYKFLWQGFNNIKWQKQFSW